MVLRVSAIVESTIKSIDITAITWKSDGSTGQNGVIARSLSYFLAAIRGWKIINVSISGLQNDHSEPLLQRTIIRKRYFLSHLFYGCDFGPKPLPLQFYAVIKMVLQSILVTFLKSLFRYHNYRLFRVQKIIV